MIRETHLANLTIQVPNPAMQLAFNVPIYMTHIQSVKSDDGTLIGNPTQQQTPMVDADVTPEVLEAINLQLASIGLVAAKLHG